MDSHVEPPIDTLGRLVIHFIKKHHKLDVLVKYVTRGQILANILLKPIERVVNSIVLTAVRTAAPTTQIDW